MRGLVCLFLVIFLTVPAIFAKEMPIPHFTPSDCDCPGLGLTVTGNSSSYNLDLQCHYDIPEPNERSSMNFLQLFITSWYKPEDTQKAFEIYRDYDYKNAKSGASSALIIEDVVDANRISFIRRFGQEKRYSYEVMRGNHYGRTPFIRINSYYAYQKEGNADKQVLKWVDALEACATALIDKQDLSGSTVQGKLSAFGFPIKNIHIYNSDDNTSSTTTDSNGNFKLVIPNQEHYHLIVELSSQKNNHEYFRVIGNKASQPIKLDIEVNNKDIQEIKIIYGIEEFETQPFKGSVSDINLDKYFSEESNDLKTVISHYQHMQEALEYYSDVLKVDMSKNTVFLYLYTGKSTSYNYNNTKKWMIFSDSRSNFEDGYRPFVHYHEFTHYVNHLLYGKAFEDMLNVRNINHGGYANEKTADSYSEGLAAFMATVIANYYDRYWAGVDEDKPSLYPLYGSLEPDTKAWFEDGQREEYAIAGILWDLIDDETDAKKDSLADIAQQRMILELFISDNDFNKDGAMQQSEFLFSLINQGEINGNYDQYFEEREIRDLAEKMLVPDKVDEFVKESMKYAKTEPDYLTLEEFHQLIKDNLEFFKEGLESINGAKFTIFPEKITVDFLMNQIKEHGQDENVQIPLNDLWKILSKPHSDFTSVYKALIDAYPSKKDEINKIFIKHGFFIDTTRGDGTFNPGEPYFDANKNSRRNDNESFIDLGEMRFTGTQVVGSASNYERPSRKSSEPMHGQFVKVNPEVPYYDIKYVSSNVIFNGLAIPSMAYTIRANTENGMIYTPLHPNAKIFITPENVTTKEPLEFSYSEFRQSTTKESGYYASHTFQYIGTPPKYNNSFSKKGNYLLIIAVVVIVLAVGIGYFFISKKKRKKQHLHH